MMKICSQRFNSILWLWVPVLAAGLWAGCRTAEPEAPSAPGAARTSKSRKEASTLRFHYVINPDGTPRCIPITVYRNHPMTFHIDRSPFLWEANIVKAEVVTNLGTYALRVEFDRSGAIALESVTTAQRSRHIAIYSDFGESRWLAAPVITQPATNGVFEFTPDASLEETQRIVRGLNNLARKKGTWFDRRKPMP
ncbi:hypothetical protein NXS98_09085 [Fontisphaera persica]|uniref:hypothetical protein n=1 Tax=Fontisphaera persica TaxID=2974023 RepID=UPI0024C066F2|nr:hypothetical protein [Fontisphaera persica]WCJ57884.1 hypothetical protein NXS98_09085 [Fontisphaera persica]